MFTPKARCCFFFCSSVAGAHVEWRASDDPSYHLWSECSGPFPGKTGPVMAHVQHSEGRPVSRNISLPTQPGSQRRAVSSQPDSIYPLIFTILKGSPVTVWFVFPRSRFIYYIFIMTWSSAPLCAHFWARYSVCLYVANRRMDDTRMAFFAGGFHRGHAEIAAKVPWDTALGCSEM